MKVGNAILSFFEVNFISVIPSARERMEFMLERMIVVYQLISSLANF